MILYPLVKYIRKNFQWFITSRDELPVIDKKGLKNFLEHGYDPELGWVRHPGTSKKKEHYEINKKGARMNPDHEALSTTISSYGDSFCFCRQNNDKTTWQWYLSEMTKTNVQNFGVGNYGLDQSFMRLKREYPKNQTKVVIMAVVPSTIVRIMCVWKYYNEYGNTLGFKPRYKIDGQIKEVKNIIDSKEKFNELEKYLPFIQEHDYFYESKFKREMIKFPYVYYILKNWRRNLPLIYYVLMGNKQKAMAIIHDINLKLRVDLYKKTEPAMLFQVIVKMFVQYAKENNFKPILLIIPQKDDVEYMKKNGNYYWEVLKLLRGNLKIIDMYKQFKIENLDYLYSDDNKYGGHPNKTANLMIAEKINRVLK